MFLRDRKLFLKEFVPDHVIYGKQTNPPEVCTYFFNTQNLIHAKRIISAFIPVGNIG
jgi:hypothetical protein